jgi:hypothetical protein
VYAIWYTLADGQTQAELAQTVPKRLPLHHAIAETPLFPLRRLEG